jgi:hypothetical protein
MSEKSLANMKRQKKIEYQKNKHFANKLLENEISMKKKAAEDLLAIHHKPDPTTQKTRDRKKSVKIQERGDVSNDNVYGISEKPSFKTSVINDDQEDLVTLDDDTEQSTTTTTVTTTKKEITIPGKKAEVAYGTLLIMPETKTTAPTLNADQETDQVLSEIQQLKEEIFIDEQEPTNEQVIEEQIEEKQVEHTTPIEDSLTIITDDQSSDLHTEHIPKAQVQGLSKVIVTGKQQAIQPRSKSAIPRMRTSNTNSIPKKDVKKILKISKKNLAVVNMSDVADRKFDYNGIGEWTDRSLDDATERLSSPQINVHRKDASRQLAISSTIQYGSDVKEWKADDFYPEQEERIKPTRNIFLSRLKAKGGKKQTKAQRDVDMKNAMMSLGRDLADDLVTKDKLPLSGRMRGRDFITVKAPPGLKHEHEMILKEKQRIRYKEEASNVETLSIYERGLRLKQLKKAQLAERVQQGIDYWMNRSKGIDTMVMDIADAASTGLDYLNSSRTSNVSSRPSTQEASTVRRSTPTSNQSRKLRKTESRHSFTASVLRNSQFDHQFEADEENESFEKDNADTQTFVEHVMKSKVQYSQYLKEKAAEEILDIQKLITKLERERSEKALGIPKIHQQILSLNSNKNTEPDSLDELDKELRQLKMNAGVDIFDTGTKTESAKPFVREQSSKSVIDPTTHVKTADTTAESIVFESAEQEQPETQQQQSQENATRTTHSHINILGLEEFIQSSEAPLQEIQAEESDMHLEQVEEAIKRHGDEMKQRRSVVRNLVIAVDGDYSILARHPMSLSTTTTPSNFLYQSVDTFILPQETPFHLLPEEFSELLEQDIDMTKFSGVEDRDWLDWLQRQEEMKMRYPQQVLEQIKEKKKELQEKDKRLKLILHGVDSHVENSMQSFGVLSETSQDYTCWQVVSSQCQVFIEDIEQKLRYLILLVDDVLQSVKEPRQLSPTNTLMSPSNSRSGSSFSDNGIINVEIKSMLDTIANHKKGTQTPSPDSIEQIKKELLQFQLDLNKMANDTKETMDSARSIESNSSSGGRTPGRSTSRLRSKLVNDLEMANDIEMSRYIDSLK